MTHPIILAHGVCRFDVLWKNTLKIDNSDNPKHDNVHYFKGIRSMLKNRGFKVYHSNVSWSGSADKRAEDLKQNIKSVLKNENTKKVNIIAHSMGGLDSRHLIFNDRNKDKIHKNIASITTISTPHWGSSFADWSLKNIPKLIPMAEKLGLDINAINDLSTESCSSFNNNPEVVAFEKNIESALPIYTYAGRQDFWGILSILKFSYSIIKKAEGDNDGLVSVESAKFREKYFRGIIDNADHINVIGWWEPEQLVNGEFPEKFYNRINKFYIDISENLP